MVDGKSRYCSMKHASCTWLPDLLTGLFCSAVSRLQAKTGRRQQLGSQKTETADWTKKPSVKCKFCSCNFKVDTSLPGPLLVWTPSCLYTSLPGHLLTRTPPYLNSSLPGHLPTRTPPCQETALPGHLPTRTPSHLNTSPPVNLFFFF